MTSADSHGAILEAALHLFAEQGVDETSTDLVRRRAGVSNGSLFHYFPTKQSLVATLYLQILSEHQTFVLRALERESESDPAAGIRALVKAHLDWVAKNASKARLLHQLRRSEFVAAAAENVAALNKQLWEGIRNWIAPHVKAGRVRDLPPELFAAILLGPTMEFTRAWLRRPGAKGMRRAADLLAETTWCAIQARGVRK